MSSTLTRYKAEFRCINESCGTAYDLNDIVYECRKCGSLLQVSHDLEALKEKSGKDWKDLFDSRFRSVKFPNSSGIWNKREWVLPHVEDKNIVSSGEGLSHLFSSERLTKDLGLGGFWIKQCGISHTGSFKDLGMTALLSQVKHMLSNGVNIRAVACASSGDTSAALASYAAKAGIPAIIFLPAGKVSQAQLIQPVSNGAKVIALETDFDGCMKIVKEVTKQAGIYLANSMNSLRIEGQKTIAPEIVQQLEWEVPDWVIIPGGNLGNVSALGAGFEMAKNLELINKLPRIVLAQAEHANPLYLSYLTNFQKFNPVEAKPTLASAIQIGNPVSVQKAIKTLKTFNGIVEQAGEAELSDAAARTDLYGLYNDPHTGVAIAALYKLLSKGVIRKGEKVVVISTAHGLKFTEFKLKFHEGKIPGTTPSLENRIRTCKPEVGNVMDEIGKFLQLKG
ncbi:threonine synthase [Leptospira inadai serovar Lyme str. 10]|uniref:Threonine synthase n=2 Tax=Leptospira inadai serovar Lyme TaxID=293084 RepID=V6H8Z3_9LEPT|nr:threonine synthase [Leptospira inadai]EQA35486.1 threonine synthase [Leptospira inadai serovar Lyme str. 10]PNV73963.1 threonine synthase [Leptospira inadai serovar Lyme]